MDDYLQSDELRNIVLNECDYEDDCDLVHNSDIHSNYRQTIKK